jgi:Ca2+:H+ antiporter
MKYARLIFAWSIVAVFLLFSDALYAALSSPALASMVFLILIGAICWSAFGVVHEAEDLAHALGEPYGTLILTLSIIIIEVALVGAVMLGSQAAPTLGRDTMYAVLMLVLGGIVGVGLFLGGLRHGEQSYNLAGATTYLSVIIPLSVIALVLPNFTTSSAPGTLTNLQALFFSAFTIFLYGSFLIIQTGRHKDLFVESSDPDHTVDVEAAGAINLPRTTALLIANILPIVILSKSLAKVLDFGIERLGAPSELGGVLIAMIVLLPEGIAAIRAITANQLQRAMNLCLGAAASTLGLTVPTVLIIGVLTRQPVTLGLNATNMVVLMTTLLVSALTFSGPRTTLIKGVVHLCMFFVFFVLIFDP